MHNETSEKNENKIIIDIEIVFLSFFVYDSSIILLFLMCIRYIKNPSYYSFVCYAYFFYFLGNKKNTTNNDIKNGFLDF